MSETTIERLTELAKEIQREVRVLSNQTAVTEQSDQPDDEEDGTEKALRVALATIANRRSRAEHFHHHDIFGEPAWDMLLDLYVHQVRRQRVSKKSAAIGSNVAPTTALRWMNALKEENLIKYEDDQFDHRRKFVYLTKLGFSTMTKYLNSIE